MSWNVYFEQPFRAWVAGASPDNATIDAVSLWVTMAEIDGPPDNAQLVRGDLFWAPVPDTSVRVEFLAVAQDRLIIVKAFG